MLQSDWQSRQIIPQGTLGNFISMHAAVKKPIETATYERIRAYADGQNPLDSLGTLDNVYAVGHESMLPALVKKPLAVTLPQVTIGSSQCRYPYKASLLNCSALSFGPMGKPFILSLNQAAKQQGFYQNTGEAGLSPYHLGLDVDIEADAFNADDFFAGLLKSQFHNTGDLVWQIGNGYFGCRNQDGTFNEAQFKRKALLPPVKMIEIKLSQGVEPASRMPVKAVTSGMSKLMGLQLSGGAVLHTHHTAFYNALELMGFVKGLRDLSGGKPVGIKLGVSHRHIVFAICKAMLKTGIRLDFITVDGMEAGTAAAAGGTLGFTGTPLQDAVIFIHNALTGCGLRDEIKIIGSGQVFTEKNILSLLARGADAFATARGMMIAVGCDQQQECYKGTCFKGIATQDPELLKRFDIKANTRRLIQYHAQTMQACNTLFSLLGLEHSSEIKPWHFQMRINVAEVLPLDEVYPFLKPNVFRYWYPRTIPKQYLRAWKQADPAQSFY